MSALEEWIDRGHADDCEMRVYASVSRGKLVCDCGLDEARSELHALRERVAAADALINRLMDNAASWADCAIGLAAHGSEKESLSRCLTRERVDFNKTRRALTAPANPEREP